METLYATLHLTSVELASLPNSNKSLEWSMTFSLVNPLWHITSESKLVMYSIYRINSMKYFQTFVWTLKEFKRAWSMGRI